MAGLVDAMRGGQVDTLLILDSNPVYAMPGFRDALTKVRFSLSAAAAPDETARAVTWHVPQTHLFESWGDIRSHDGAVTIQQPQALPLYDGRSAFEILALFDDRSPGGTPVRDGDIVRAAWRAQLDDDTWADALAAGVVPGTTAAAGCRCAFDCDRFP